MKSHLSLAVIIFVVFCTSSLSAQQDSVLKYIEKRKSPATAVIATVLLPGAGHWYAGDTDRGLIFFAGGLISYYAFDWSVRKGSGRTIKAAIVGYLIFEIIASENAYTTAQRYNDALKKQLNLAFNLNPTSPAVGVQFNF